MIWNFIRPLSQQHSSSSDMTVPTNNQWCVPFWSKCTSIYFVNQVAMNQLWFFILMQPNSNQNHNVPLQEDHKNRILVRKRLSGRSSSLPVMLTTSYVLFFSWEKKKQTFLKFKVFLWHFPYLAQRALFPPKARGEDTLWGQQKTRSDSGSRLCCSEQTVLPLTLAPRQLNMQNKHLLKVLQ